MTLKRILSVFLLSGLLSISTSAGIVQPADSQDNTAETAAKINAYLKDSGYEYKQVDPTVWVINHKGNAVPNPQTLMVVTGQMLIVGVVVVEKKDFQVTADSMFKLLHLAHDIDYIKVGIDDDGDLFVRSEVRTRAMNLTEFKNTVEIVFSAADKAYLTIKPYLNQK